MLHIKLPVRGAVLHQVQRSQVARGVVEEHIFAAGIRSIDARGVLARVPAVTVVSYACRVAAVPSRIGDLGEQIARAQFIAGCPS